VLTVDGDVTDEHLTAAREAAETLLSNPVIEDVVSVRELRADEDTDR
jgi:phosphoribosylformylglycinamidine synthase